MVDKQPNIKNLRVLGTDGESELAKAFKQHCPSLIHLLCFNHVRRNIKDKLTSMKVAKPVISMVLDDRSLVSKLEMFLSMVLLTRMMKQTLREKFPS